MRLILYLYCTVRRVLEISLSRTLESHREQLVIFVVLDGMYSNPGHSGLARALAESSPQPTNLNSWLHQSRAHLLLPVKLLIEISYYDRPRLPHLNSHPKARACTGGLLYALLLCFVE